MRRRGGKEQPFEVGEKVFIRSKGTTGRVTQVIHAPPRGRMKYLVEYTPVGVRVEEFSCGLLEETLGLHGEELETSGSSQKKGLIDEHKGDD